MKPAALIAAAVAAVLLAAPAPAANAATTITYTGIAGGTSGNGDFGATMGNIFSPFTAVVTLTDTASHPTYGVPGRALYADSGSNGVSLFTATLTIGGVSKQIGAEYREAYSLVDNFGGTDGINHGGSLQRNSPDYSIQNGFSLAVDSRVNNILNSIDPNAPFSYAVQTGDSARGFFSFLEYNRSTEMLEFEAEGVLLIRSVSVGSGLSAAPEPATWAMMIGGFGAAGAGLRRRRAAALG